MGRVLAIHEDTIQSDTAGRAFSCRFTGIGIDIKMGKIAAGNIKANTMSLFKKIRRGKGLDLKLIDFTGLHPFRARPGIAKPHPKQSVGDVHGKSPGKIVGRRITIDQFDRDIRIRAI